MNAPLDAWFESFAQEHRRRHPRAQLPSLDSDDGATLYGTWLKLLRRIEGLDREAITAASERMVAEPAPPLKHFSTLLAFTREAIANRKRAEGKRTADTTTREGAEALSRGCDRCGASGLVIVYRTLPLPERCPPTCGAHCVCALGRWMRGQISRQGPDLIKRIPDLDDAIKGRGPWLLEQPDPSEVHEAPPF